VTIEGETRLKAPKGTTVENWTRDVMGMRFGNSGMVRIWTTVSFRALA
jgi:hypothetical protein